MRLEATWEFVEKYYSANLAEKDSPENVWYTQWLGRVQGKEVLCLGCGPNLFDDAQFFAELPVTLVGVDVNQNNFEFLRRSRHPEVSRHRQFLKERGVITDLIMHDCRVEYPQFVSRFDTVYAVGLLGMFARADAQEILRHAKSYLKPGGRLLDVDWSDPRLSDAQMKERLAYAWYASEGLGISGVGELLAESGFDVLEYSVFTVPDPEAYEWGAIYAYLAQAQ